MKMKANTCVLFLLTQGAELGSKLMCKILTGTGVILCRQASNQAKEGCG